MCGILFCAPGCRPGACAVRALQDAFPLVARRGPDYFGVVSGEGQSWACASSVLHLRGDKVTPQPIVDVDGNALQWNGEIFGGLEVAINENDGLSLSKALTDALSNTGTASWIREEVALRNAMEKIEGPYAFVYMRKSSNRVYFGRDPYGRRSLLWRRPVAQLPFLTIASVAPSTAPASHDNSVTMARYTTSDLHCTADTADSNARCCLCGSSNEYTHKDSQTDWPPWEEIPADGLRWVQLSPTEGAGMGDTAAIDADAMMRGMGWIAWNRPIGSGFCLDGARVPDAPDVRIDDCVRQFHSVLMDAVRRRVESIPPLPPCPHSAYACDVKRHVPPGTSSQQQVERSPQSHDSPGSTRPYMQTNADASTLPPTRVGVLFSGGIDCTVLASMIDRCLPPGEPIDLINVAFENSNSRGAPTVVAPVVVDGSRQKTAQTTATTAMTTAAVEMTSSSASTTLPRETWSSKKKKGTEKVGQKASATAGQDPDDPSPHVTDADPYAVPDRLSGMSSARVLASTSVSRREFRLVCVDVSRSMLDAHREHILDLLYPLDTVMDFSIAAAIWFAARGEGSATVFQSVADSADAAECVPSEPIVSASGAVSYTSGARVLILGMGADEQLGGGLAQEMHMQLCRIPKRNLGRDDRCISDCGKEARYPFLDEHVTSFLSSLPADVKADMTQPRGVGDKQILRLVAKQELGLPRECWALAKRAIQFGSRSAKMDSKGEKGCDRLKSAAAGSRDDE